jgi:rod shape-determining protein MreD
MAVARGRNSGFLGEIGVTRIAAMGGVVILALALQSTLLARLTILGVIPQLVLLVVVALAFLEGERVGVVVGFFGGLLLDLQLPPGSILGLTALVYTMIGFGVGTLRQFSLGESVWAPVFVVAASSAIAEGSYALLSILMGQPWVSLSMTAQLAGLVVLYNTLLTPFVFPVVKRIADRVRPERVFS